MKTLVFDDNDLTIYSATEVIDAMARFGTHVGTAVDPVKGVRLERDGLVCEFQAGHIVIDLETLCESLMSVRCVVADDVSGNKVLAVF